MRRLAATALTGLLITACGSTVEQQALQQSGSGPGAGTSTDGLGMSGPQVPGAIDPVTGEVVTAPGDTTTAGGGGTATGSTGGATTSGGAAPGQPAGGSPGAVSGPVRLGPGVTDKTVKIGMIYSSNLNEAQKATGRDDLGTGDPKAQQQALIDEINRTGGFGGRRVILDAYSISATTSDAEQAFNAACAHFVQDAKVFAVITAGPKSFGVCLEKGGVLHVGSDLTAATDKSTALQPHGLRPAGITMEDSARLLVEGLNQQGYFANSVVGVITFDSTPHMDAVKKVMLPALERIGHKAKDAFYVQSPKGVSDYGSMSSSISSAVLRFRTNGVTHVIIFDQQGRITTFFTPAAESQEYRPRYGFTSQAGFQVGLNGGGVAPEQAKDAAGIGWLPAFDVPVDRAKLSPGAKRCDDFFSRKGMPAAGENAMLIQQFQCQDAWLLDTVMDRLTADVTREAFVRVAETAGPLLSAAGLGMGFDAAHHDGATVVRNVGWDGGCGCFRYVGGDRRVR